MSIGKEILLMKARIAEMKNRLENMGHRAANHIRTIREIVDVYGDYTDFDMDRALAAMQDFHYLWKEAKRLKAEIARIEKEING